jgi:hypothetical protein
MQNQPVDPIRRCTRRLLDVLCASVTLSAAVHAASADNPATNAKQIVAHFQSADSASELSNRNLYMLCWSTSTEIPSESNCPVGSKSTWLEANSPLKAGKKVLGIIQVDRNDDCSKYSMTVTKIPVTPTDQNPVRGAQPPKGPTFSANLTSSAANSSNLKYCYAVYPDPLTADNYTSVVVTSKAWTSTELPLPEIHTFYRFGISTGVAISSVKNHTYGYTPNSTSSKFSYTQSGSSRLLEPVLFLTYYPLNGGLDSEAKASWKDLGVAMGLSEKNPTTSFYLGVSTEPIRNIAFVVGANLSQGSILDVHSYDPGPAASHTTPPTRLSYRGGAFVAVNFNFSNFLQQVFK